MCIRDRTNIDSIGIITARAGVNVSGGQLDVGSNIKLGNAGVITATSFSGSGANLTGITGTTINNNADNRVITGSGTANTLEGESALTFSGQTLSVYGAAGDPGRIQLKEGGAVSQIMTTRNSDTNGDLRFSTEVSGSLAVRAKINYSGDFEIPDKIVHEGDTNTAIRFPAADTITFETTGGERLRITSGGNLLAAGITTSNTGFMFGTNGEHYLYKSAANTATLRVTSDGPYVEFKDVSGDVQLGSASGTLRLSASAAEKVRIQADGSCYFGPQIITEADMNWGHDAHQRPFIFSGNQAGVNPADATIVVANPNTDPPSTRLGSFMFGCKTSSGGNSGIKAYIEGWTTSNPSNTYEAGGYIKFVTRQSGYGLTEHFKIDHDGKLYKSGNHFYPLVNYTEVATFTGVSITSSSYTDLRTILSSYSPKKAGNLIVIHHQSQCWQGADANSNGDAMWKMQRQEGGGSWTDVIANERIMGNMDGRSYTGGSGLSRHHRTVHLMGSFTCAGTSINLKTQGKMDFTGVGLQWYHHSQNILQVWEYEKG